MSVSLPNVSPAQHSLGALRYEVSKAVVGQESAVTSLIIALLCRGHVLLEGVPGTAKTLLVRTLAKSMDLKFGRIQCTPDLMPADVLGTHWMSEEGGRREFRFRPGPIFGNIVLADEVNRATPKTQSAMLEAMQDVSVSVGKTTYQLEQPFLVLATQNPLEMEGTYPLPEAQLDRFFFKLKVTYPTEESMHGILERTTGLMGSATSGSRPWRSASLNVQCPRAKTFAMGGWPACP